MGSLVHHGSGASVTLHANHLVGRSEHCDLRIAQKHVSTEHASIRWNGQGWVLKDLGSRNKTFKDGESVSSSSPVLLSAGCTLAFGLREDTWRLEDSSGPEAVAIPLDGGQPMIAVNALLPVPSQSKPSATVYRGPDGSWKLDEDGEIRDVTDGGIFEVEGRAFRLSLPSAVLPTVPVGSFEPLRVKDIELEFSVSADEEHVEIVASTDARALRLAARTHNYLLLELARRRAADAWLPDTSCGWIYQDELCERLRVDLARLNVDVYRIRKQFASLEVLDPASIIERRSRTKQIRLGVKRFKIAQI
jgi:FHA domain